MAGSESKGKAKQEELSERSYRNVCYAYMHSLLRKCVNICFVNPWTDRTAKKIPNRIRNAKSFTLVVIRNVLNSPRVFVRMFKSSRFFTKDHHMLD